MHRYQFYLLATVLIIFLVINIHHHEVHANPAENVVTVQESTTKPNEHKPNAKASPEYVRQRPFMMLPFRGALYGPH